MGYSRVKENLKKKFSEIATYWCRKENHRDIGMSFLQQKKMTKREESEKFYTFLPVKTELKALFLPPPHGSPLMALQNYKNIIRDFTYDGLEEISILFELYQFPD